MHMVLLDEFGHIGPFISRKHSKYNTSPVFGVAGFFLHERQVREFATWFYKLKNDFFEEEIKNSSRHAATWEKKGHEIFTSGRVYRNKRLGYSLTDHNAIVNTVVTVSSFQRYDPRSHRWHELSFPRRALWAYAPPAPYTPMPAQS
jgi:hypothetical protein